MKARADGEVDASATSGESISRLSGEFVDAQIERAFVESIWPRQANLYRTVTLVGAVAFTAALALDVSRHGGTSMLWFYVGVRLLGVGAFAAMAWYLSRGPYRPRVAEVLFGGAVLVAVSYLVGTFEQRDRAAFLLLSALVLVFANYMFLMNRFVYTVGVAAVLSIGLLTSTVALGAAGGEEKILVVILLGAVNCIGIALIRSVNRSSRREYSKSRALERAIAQRVKAEEAAAIDRAKSRFFMNLSHELRTPIHGIIGYVDLIDEQAEAGDLRTLRADLGEIRRAGVRLHRTLANTVELSRIEAGQVPLRMVEVDLQALLDGIKGELAPLAAAHNNPIRVAVAAGTEAFVTDRALLRYCLQALLDNAIRYSQDAVVEVDACAVGSALTIAVRDRGVGIAPERLEGLFEPFARIDESRAPGHEGSGLTLAVAQRFCELLGGSISLESEPGQGSVFTLRVPRSPARDD